ncbi:MAG TPA: hypothetical protein VE075_00600 [Thermoanaerobaculia bacterium]|nr:hypothetical protein [Thermoanaerobaculia bacterium]
MKRRLSWPGAPLAAVCVGALAILGPLGCRPGRGGHGSGASAAPVLAFDAASQSVRAAGLDRQLLAALAKQMPEAAALGRAFGVYLGDARVPMLGSYRVEGNALRFSPRLPLLAGRHYRAVLDPRLLAALAGPRLPPRAGANPWPPPAPGLRPPAGADPRLPAGAGGPVQPAAAVLQMWFECPAPPPPLPAARTRVTAVFPSGGVVPANLLRLYVHFSQPMSRRGIARHVRLLDGAGNPVPRAFLEMPDGLWDPAGRRLTLFLHPGRIKRGVGLHEALGLPLHAGRRYRLVIGKEAEDAAGMQLAGPYVKELRAAAPDRSSPDVRRWRLDAPPPGSRQALTVVADKPLDQALFARTLRLFDAAGRPVRGQASVAAGEVRWQFVPGEPWHEGDYVLRVGAELEDLAGNRPTRLFDDPAAPGGARREARGVELRLRIGPAAPEPPG